MISLEPRCRELRRSQMNTSTSAATVKRTSCAIPSPLSHVSINYTGRRWTSGMGAEVTTSVSLRVIRTRCIYRDHRSRSVAITLKFAP
jgi:hypothetical protein